MSAIIIEVSFVAGWKQPTKEQVRTAVGSAHLGQAEGATAQSRSVSQSPRYGGRPRSALANRSAITDAKSVPRAASLFNTVK